MVTQYPGHSPIRFRECPSGVPDVQCLGKNIVVHEAGVDREQSHQKNDVTTAVD
jgi:hypothetical protein